MEALNQYEEVWNDFITGNHISTGSIWGGEVVALVIPLGKPDLVQNILTLQSKLSSEMLFEPLPSETLHITIKQFGKLSSEEMPDLLSFLREKLVLIPKFDIELIRVNSFFRAPFLEIGDGGMLSTITAVLEAGFYERNYPKFDFGQRGQIFHLTLGAYLQGGDGITARKLLKQLRLFTAGTVQVKELWLVRTSEGKPYRFTHVETIPLMVC